MAGLVATHTGAGNCTDETKYQRVIKEACMRGTQVLQNGGSVVDACEAAIIRLENSGNTNAGFGSNLTWDGKIECEASLMDGSNLQFGACTNVSNIKNPIQLARIICDRQSTMLALERIPPMILTGEGASNFAKEIGGITIVESDQLKSGKALRCHEHYKGKVARYEDFHNTQVSSLDTVGAICIDVDGNCAAGCSSGGLILKISGRIGQAATYGAGCWSQTTDSTSSATCTTGNGEYLMKTLLAKEIVTNLLECECPVTSIHKTFTDKFLESPFLNRSKELYGGALSLYYDKKTGNGDLLWSHTTKSLCLGYMLTNQKTPKFVNSTLPTYSIPGFSVAVNGQPFKLL